MMESLINEYAVYRNRDYFDCRDSAGRVAIAEKMMLPPAPMVKMGQFWGDGWSVVVAGDEGHMLREVDRLRRNELTRVAARLPIWC